MRGKGRHDPCVLPRAVPMVEAMVALVLVDALMQHHAQCNLFPSDVDFTQNSSLEDGTTTSSLPNPLGKKLQGFGRLQ